MLERAMFPPFFFWTYELCSHLRQYPHGSQGALTRHILLLPSLLCADTTSFIHKHSYF